jgi:hypothetical protein
VAQVCNPSYSGGRDQEDWGLKPAWANSHETLSLKNPSQEKELVEWLRRRPGVQTPVQQQKNPREATKRRTVKERICLAIQCNIIDLLPEFSLWSFADRAQV